MTHLGFLPLSPLHEETAEIFAWLLRIVPPMPVSTGLLGVLPASAPRVGNPQGAAHRILGCYPGGPAAPFLGVPILLAAPTPNSFFIPSVLVFFYFWFFHPFLNPLQSHFHTYHFPGICLVEVTSTFPSLKPVIGALLFSYLAS